MRGGCWARPSVLWTTRDQRARCCFPFFSQKEETRSPPLSASPFLSQLAKQKKSCHFFFFFSRFAFSFYNHHHFLVLVYVDSHEVLLRLTFIAFFFTPFQSFFPPFRARQQTPAHEEGVHKLVARVFETASPAYEPSRLEPSLARQKHGRTAACRREREKREIVFCTQQKEKQKEKIVHRKRGE